MSISPNSLFAFYYVRIQKGKTIQPIACVCLGYDGRLFYRGVSICSEEDNFSYKTARNIAQGRCMRAMHRELGDGYVGPVIGDSGHCSANIFTCSTEYKITHQEEANITPVSDHEKKIMEKLQKSSSSRLEPKIEKPETKRALFYILDNDHNVVPCLNVMEWGKWITKHGYVSVAKDEVGTDIVFTCFVGVDQNLCRTKKPAVFETIWFKYKGELVAERQFTSTWAEANEAHAQMLKKL